MGRAKSRLGAYAPLSALRRVLEVVRAGHLPAIATRVSLVEIGVAEGNSYKTLFTLEFLGLVVDGEWTDLARELATVPNDDYQSVSARMVRDAYWDVFEQINPVEANDLELRDAFRHFTPDGQWERMLTLFRGLCKEAGIYPRVAMRHRRSTSGNSVEQVPASLLERASSPERDLMMAVMKQLPRKDQWTDESREKWLTLVAAAADWQMSLPDGREEAS